MELTNFSFNTDIIQVFDEQGQYVSVKNLCKNIGIDFKTQYEKILSDESFCPKSFKIETNGGAQVALCIPVEKINGWLFSINPNKVKPEIKTKLILYKNECFDVLYKHFNASKFEHYVSKIADLEAVRISQNDHHQRQINGYKSQISRHNTQIATLKRELKKAQIADIFASLDLSEAKFQPFSQHRPSYKELWLECINILGNRNALKAQNEALRAQNEKLISQNKRLLLILGNINAQTAQL